MLLQGGRETARERERPSDSMSGFASWLFVVVAAANVASFLLECGFGPCPDNPVGYLWLPSK